MPIGIYEHKKGYKRNPEIGKKISQSKMGHSVSAETRKKISEYRKGKKHTEEYKNKMRIIMTGRDAYWMKGKKLSEETRKKISEGHKGLISWHKDKNLSEEHKSKISKAHKKRWDKIGRKKYKRYIHSTKTIKYKQWRTAVFKRDNFTCQKCGITKCCLEAHHIKSWAKYPKSRYKLNNGLTLCQKCHLKTRKNYKN